ncbi:hypothetical protein FB107DRAFT_252857 [Schizophyllum commune]
MSGTLVYSGPSCRFIPAMQNLITRPAGIPPATHSSRKDYDPTLVAMVLVHVLGRLVHAMAPLMVRTSSSCITRHTNSFLVTEFFDAFGTISRAKGNSCAPSPRRRRADAGESMPEQSSRSNRRALTKYGASSRTLGDRPRVHGGGDYRQIATTCAGDVSAVRVHSREMKPLASSSAKRCSSLCPSSLNQFAGSTSSASALNGVSRTAYRRNQVLEERRLRNRHETQDLLMN